MPTKKEFEIALDKVANYVRRIDNEILDEESSLTLHYESQNGDLYDFSGYKCLHNDVGYVIVGNPEFEFMSVVYFMNLHQLVLNSITQEEAQEIIDDDENQPKNEKIIAAEKLLEETDVEEMEAAKSYIYMQLSGDDHLIEIESTPTGAMIFLSVERKIFPYNDGFGLQELNDSVTTIVSVGEKANNLIPRILNINKTNDENGYKLRFDPRW